MGNQVIVNILTDVMHQLEQSPHALTHLLTNPIPHEDLFHTYCQMAAEHGRKHGEQGVGFVGGGIQVLPAFHADCITFLVAGHNTLQRLPFVGFEKDKEGRFYAKVIIPDWVVPKESSLRQPKKRKKVTVTRKAEVKR